MAKSRDMQLRLPFPHLRFSPSILKRLGEELNPNPDHGLIELVKNSYDADARHCAITLANTNDIGGRIVITDDGDGMTREQIEEQWLVLGQSAKSQDTITRLGRTPVGNKGLGRLAALRMGRKVSLISRPDVEPGVEYAIEIDWDDFENVSVVEEVELKIHSRRRGKNVGNGTEITLSGLRCRLTRMDVKRLARGLLLLANPFDSNPLGFYPELLAPEFKDLEKLVQQRYFQDAEFHLSAEVNDRGEAHATVRDWKGQVLFDAKQSDLGDRTTTRYMCPAARFDLWAFLLSKSKFSARNSTLEEVRDWLKEFGGIHFYAEGMRVAPYGNPGNDWLDLNVMRAQRQEETPSTNNSIGRVSVDDRDHRLTQKTDRSGLMENEAFNELKRFATDALRWMAKRRLQEAERRRQAERVEAPKQVTEAKKTVEEAIETLPATAKHTVKEAFHRYDSARQKEATTLHKEVLLYRTLSTAGITAAVFAHESTQPVRVIKQTASQIGRVGFKEFGKHFPEVVGEKLDRIERQAESLAKFSQLTLSQLDHEKRRTSKVEVHDVICKVIKLLTPLAEQRKVTFQTELADGRPFLRATEAAIESIITNPIANSLKAFADAVPGSHTVCVRTEIVDEILKIYVLDNGPGIQGIRLKEIWLPGETTYPNGTGLGLTIVRDTVRDLGGTVDAVSNGEFGGAEIIIELPILGA